MKSYGMTIQMKPRQQFVHMKPFAFSIVQKKIWKFFLVVFSIWSLLKSGSRASLRVQHISKLKKNAIKWPGYFTLCCSPQTGLKMNSCWVHLLKC